MSLKNIDGFDEVVALYVNGYFPSTVFDSIRNSLKEKGKIIIPLCYKQEEDFSIVQAGINLADKLYVVNARPRNEITQKVIDHAVSQNKTHRVFDDLMNFR
ncbi:MAG: hypothetical protein M1416_01310 [Candidatus Pacearchaeota archaeon]|nr:hypothetical protein [Candidatus Pacearchaeota archaeon]